MMDAEFPSLLYLYREWLRDVGQVQLVSSSDGIRVDLDQIMEAIDERTLLVSLSHVLFRSAFVVDIGAVIEHAHRMGAYVLVDVFQSLGNNSNSVNYSNLQDRVTAENKTDFLTLQMFIESR